MSTGIISNIGPMSGNRPSQSTPRGAAAGFLIALAALIALPACSDSDNGDGSTKVNGSVHVPAGKPPAAATTVNGSIHIDDNAAVTSASTVNGSVHLGEHATATSLQSVNGSITLGAGAHLSGDASSVNGELSLAEGAEILRLTVERERENHPHLRACGRRNQDGQRQYQSLPAHRVWKAAS